MKKFNPFILALLLTSVFNYSCKKEAADPEKASINFQFDFNVAGVPLEFNKFYTINGSSVSFVAANFYLGGLQLTQANSQVIDLSDQYLLAGTGNIASLNSDIEVSDISKIQFFVGVDAATNAQTEIDFTSRTASDPLAIQDPSMHWSWVTGYKFVRVDGNLDIDNDGVADTPVAYHLGTNAMLKTFDIPTNINLKGGENNIVISFDLAKFFTTVDLNVEHDTHTGNNLPLAEKLRDNLSSAIIIQ
ncbi:MAG: hypothetical protein IPL46_13305 [Saprospiraceae bacterium]|nr:hypothetical protein [Saprospiraceae bacterium]